MQSTQLFCQSMKKETNSSLSSTSHVIKTTFSVMKNLLGSKGHIFYISDKDTRDSQGPNNSKAGQSATELHLYPSVVSKLLCCGGCAAVFIRKTKHQV